MYGSVQIKASMKDKKGIDVATYSHRRNVMFYLFFRRGLVPLIVIFFLCKSPLFAFEEKGPLPDGSMETIALKRRFGAIVLKKTQLEEERKAWVRAIGRGC